MHTSSLRMHARSMHTHIHHENPSPKIRHTENRAKPKTKETNNLTCF